MPSSGSEDFESADEGHDYDNKKERKKRISSSNYSDNSLENERDLKKSNTKRPLSNPTNKPPESADGWDDFDIDDNELVLEKPLEEPKQSNSLESQKPSKVHNVDNLKENKQSEDTGWDDFGDWSQDSFTTESKMITPNNQSTTTPVDLKPDIKSVTDQLAATSTKTSGWGWGWGMDSLLSTATAGITTITNQVSQGISTVLESGIGAPEPEELAMKRAKDEEDVILSDNKSPDNSDRGETNESGAISGSSGDVAFPFGSILSGVTKFVETTGTKVIAGGLDTLETIGKKTMEVLQDGDPGLAKKRAMLGLDPGDKPVLSQILREAKSRADEEDRIREEKREAKEVHYENLFDDFEGLVHLEALEMLSRQVNMRIEERLRSAEPEEKQEIKETLQQVAELCEMPEEEEEFDDSPVENLPKPEALQERLQTSTRDIGIKVQFQPLVKQYKDILEFLSSADLTEKAIYKRAISSLAQATALSVEIYHKTAEMLLVKTRRSTADESDALTQMTVVLTKHISELANLFTEKLNSLSIEDKQQINTYITNIFLEAGNSSTYIQNAFQLALPILQIGAV